MILNRLIGHFSHLELFPILGAPGSGKGYCGGYLAEVSRKFRTARIVMKDTINEYKNHPELAREFMSAERLIKAGELAPNGPVIKALALKIGELELKGATKILIDGFPRNKEQVQEIVGSGLQVTPFEMVLSPEECIKNVEKGKKKGDRGNRDDDNVDILLKRIGKYFDGGLGQEVKEEFRKAGKDVVEIDGSLRASLKIAFMARNMGFGEDMMTVLFDLTQLAGKIDDERTPALPVAA